MTRNIPAVINEELNELVLAFNIWDILPITNPPTPHAEKTMP